jgi:hypothetical protein
MSGSTLRERLAANGLYDGDGQAAITAVAEWLRDEASAQWKRAEDHDWEPSRLMAMIRAMWLTERAIELEETADVR